MRPRETRRPLRRSLTAGFCLSALALAAPLAADMADTVVDTAALRLGKGPLQSRVVVTDDLVMVGVGQFVQDDGRVFDHVVSRQKRRRPRDVDLFRQSRIVASRDQPIDHPGLDGNDSRY